MLCPICNNDDTDNYLELLRCRICNHIFSKNIYDEQYWKDLYENKYTTVDRKFDATRNGMYVQEINWIQKFKELKGSFLDVGCSYGNFFMFLPKEIKKIGIDVSDTVINESKIMHPDCEFYKTLLCDYELRNKFDFIQFRGVLQHVTDPVGNLRCAISLLEKNGIIIITSMPDFSSITSRFYKEKFTFYVPKICPNFFTKKSFCYMLKSLGLKISLQQSPYFKTPYANFPKDLVSFFTNLLRNKTNPPFYGNVKNYIIEIDHSIAEK